MSERLLNIAEVGRVPIRQAAKRIGKSRAYVRKLIEAGEVIGYRVGGTDGAPWLQVDLAELEAAHRRLSIYCPKGAKRNRPYRPAASRQLEPAAAAM